MQCQAQALLLLLLSVLLLLQTKLALAQPVRPGFSFGSLLFQQAATGETDSIKYGRAAGFDARTAGNAEGSTAAAAAQTQHLLHDCAASAVADFSSRLALPQWDPTWTPITFEDKRQGPYLSIYPRVQQEDIPRDCNPLQWAYRRLLAAIDMTIQMKLNYCHFRAPAYVAPQEVRMVCVPLSGADAVQSRHLNSSSSSSNDQLSVGGAGSSSSSSSSVGDGRLPSCVRVRTIICNSEGLHNVKHPWRGLDCSNLVAWIYNFGFGFYPTTVLAEAACHPTYAPGRLLHNVTTAHLDQLRPGDLVFGRQSRRHANAPAAVLHVAVWTGYTVDFSDSTSPFYNETLLDSIPEAHWNTYVRCMTRQLSHGRPVHVIADSNFAGPAYRPFCGHYLTNFSHARRILTDSRDAWLYVNHAKVARWDSSTKSCVSKWALVKHRARVQQPHTRPHTQQQQQYMQHYQMWPS